MAAWAVQIEHLTDAYLHWKSGRPAPRFPVDVEMSWDIPLIDLFSMHLILVQNDTDELVARKSLTVYCHWDSVYKNIALVHNGSIGCAPQAPSVCLTLRTLEDYRQGHRVNPRMTIQAQVRKMCALHNVSDSQVLLALNSFRFRSPFTIILSHNSALHMMYISLLFVKSTKESITRWVEHL